MSVVLLVSLHAPATPSYNHVGQCAVYAARYNFKVPVKLVYVTKTGYEIFDSESSSLLTTSELQKSFKNLNNIARRREKIFGMFENQTRENLITAFKEKPSYNHHCQSNSWSFYQNSPPVPSCVSPE